MYSEKEIIQKLNLHGGLTCDLEGRMPSEGFAVGGYVPQEVFPYSDTMRGAKIQAFLMSNAEILSEPGFYFGAWINEGLVYLDVSRITQTQAEAMAIAIARKEKAIYDLGAGQEVPATQAA